MNIFTRIGIRWQMLLILLGLGCLPLTSVVWLLSSHTDAGFAQLRAVVDQHSRDEALDKLVALRDTKRDAVQSFLQRRLEEVGALAQTELMSTAIERFHAGFHALRAQAGIDDAALADMRTRLHAYYDGAFAERYARESGGQRPPPAAFVDRLGADTVALQYRYIVANPNPIGEKDRLANTGGDSDYDRAHAALHPGLDALIQRLGFYDVFLIDPDDGDILYTAFKETDFATNVRSGPWAGSGIETIWDAARKLPAGGTAIVDLQPYTPSYDEAAGFIGAPVYRDHTLLGVLVFQYSMAEVTRVMAERSGLGDSGETYLIGPDQLPRTDTRFDTAHHSVKAAFRQPPLGRIDGAAIRTALAGNSGAGESVSYDGRPVLSAYAPLQVGGLHWALLAEISRDEALRALQRTDEIAGAIDADIGRTATTVVLGATALIVAVALWLAAAIARPLRRTAAALRSLAGGELRAALPTTRGDEIGQMEVALNQSLAGIRAALKAEQVSWPAVAAQRDEIERITAMVEHAPVAMFFADADGVLRYANPCGKTLLGRLNAYLPPGAGPGAELRRLLVAPEAFEQLRDSGQRQIVDWGPESLSQNLVTIRSHDGTLLGTLLSWELITERVAARRAAEAAAAHERAVAAALQLKVDALLDVVNAAAEGELRAHFDIDGNDAIAQVGTGLEQLLRGLRHSIASIDAHASTVAEAAQELNTLSQRLGEGAGSGAQQADQAADAADAVSQQMQSIAAAAEQMSATVQEIARNTTSASSVALEAVRSVGTFGEIIERLEASGSRIGKVIGLIDAIAEQTNLLALNATIEAARAGEAGKGFAVVAHEVKELAKETGKATADIAEAIAAIDAETRDVAAAAASIRTIIDNINVTQTGIAAAAEQQNTVTGDIARAVGEANQAVQEIARRLHILAGLTGDTRGAGLQLLDAAGALDGMAAGLQQSVGHFRY
ncbi:methyl-accepting chemotaxis protein [Plasticicumulans acidivorans]|uniref:Methyl-accepting chemotaxis protein n=1 Tax=Plasticicumulans acidivorans TaxID=886464 RepID=A0A317MZY1_9GAMM|nr:methyl-accepting chemotaxis protein [Plasticicumulans acidivorans]PWV64862.1 methyl-accepting chemotaxis protein [Plasticicumulans acidivorans]